MAEKDVEIGIIGGTGMYDPVIIKEAEDKKVYTPFGRTSDLISVGFYEGKKIAFIPRHGRKHQIPPHKIPSKANIWALKELGVKRIISPSAVGSLRENYRAGEFVLVDQFIDRTAGRPDTFYDGGQVCHISTADPTCSELRTIFVKSARELGIPFHNKGTYICIQGPRFSTRAESRLFRAWGVDVIGMTLYPEIALAREVEICYVPVAMITDYDVWAEKPVSTDEIIRTMEMNVDNFKKLIMHTIPKIPEVRKCSCKDALKEALL
ncbi:MAG: S-methyl-5-thioadenosine phosphorylase [Thermoproteota archaeon]|nr:S-methyl-5-thioadenosine phosphorylase [Thermoproteota archaeon]